MKKMMQVARREFFATVMTVGFLIGLLIMPLMMGLMIWLMPLLIDMKSPAIGGEIAVLDGSGQVLDRVKQQLSPEAFVERRRAMDERINAVMPDMARKAMASGAGAQIDQSMKQILGEVPDLKITAVESVDQLESIKARLLLPKTDPGALLSVIVVHEHAVVPSAVGAELAAYDLYIREKLDDRLVSDLRDGMKTAIVDARLAVRQLNADDIRAITRMPYVKPQLVTKDGDLSNSEIAGKLLPMAFMILILISVMTAGQQLMTSTIEEKSSRVVEVLLAAVSPTELMGGKILGQMGVGLLMLLLYGGLLILALFSFSIMGLVDPWMLLYLLIFFFIAFTTMAALMAAIGAAVNELREAQSLLTPVILVVMLPAMLWMPITNNPDSMLATVLSLVPPVSPFVMIIRMASSSPPPMWQVWLSILIGIAGMLAAVWFAGKVFRIGLLMHGKPPSFMTLLRWVRMA